MNILLLVTTEHWASSKLHIFRHFASEAREKGALTTISSDRTEIWHKVLKAGYARSNRNDKCNEFIVKYVSRITAFRVKVTNLDLESPIIPTPEQVIDDANGPSVVSDVSAGGADRGVELDVEDNDEELELEALPSEGNQMTLTPMGRTWRWPKRVRKGWPRLASSTEDVVGLSGFRAAVAGWIRNRLQKGYRAVTATVTATSTRSRVRQWNIYLG